MIKITTPIAAPNDQLRKENICISINPDIIIVCGPVIGLSDSPVEGIILMAFAPRMSNWLLISVFMPWVTLMSPVTAAHPMSIPSRFYANLNFLSFIPPKDICAISCMFILSHFILYGSWCDFWSRKYEFITQFSTVCYVERIHVIFMIYINTAV